MKIKKLNFQMAEEYKEMSMTILCFFRPLHGKLFRVAGLPDCDNPTELDQVLNTLCLRKKDGVWYFKNIDDEWLEDTLQIFKQMKIVATTIEPDEVTWN